jgi:prepilin-type N-terminal cleavage/methylation domain-containing protein
LTRGRPQAGFTLLELLIAMAVLAIVMAIIYESYWICTKSVAAAQERSDIYQSARLALRRLSDDLMGAYVPLSASAGTEEESSEEGEAPSEAGKSKEGSAESVFRSLDIGSGPASQDTLEFVSTANLGRGAAAYVDFCELSYSVNGGILTRSSSAGAGADPQSFELASNVKGLDLKFFDPEGEEHAEWDSSQSGQLPATVEITLYMGTGQDEAAAVPFTTAVNIPLAWEREALGRGVATLAAEEEAAQEGKEGASEKKEKKKKGSGSGGSDLDEDEDDDEGPPAGAAAYDEDDDDDEDDW